MRYRFDQFELDAERFELVAAGEQVHAEPQILELLTYLVVHRERMVSREELNEAVWKGRIVSEAALSGRIKMLRKLIGDDGRSQRLIRTVHGKGFRFHAPVVEIAVDEKVSKPQSEPDREPQVKPPTVAVMPFDNLTDGDQYFSDGISADIINLLSKHRWLNVVARNTTFGFRGSTQSAKDIGEALGADYLVEGSVQRSADRIRVSVHLVDARTGFQTWADRYHREMDDIFAVQDEITEKVAARLEPEIGSAERQRIVVARPTNLQAWDCFHLGVYHFYRFTGDDNERAQALLKQSQILDPRFGDAYAWWAYATVIGMVYWNTEPDQSRLDDALSACDTALSLDPHNATFYALRARVLLARKEYDRAIAENLRAIDLNPTFAAAHCGLGDSLAYEGRYDEAIDAFEKAVSLSPNDPQLWAFYSYGALMFLFKQDFETALSWSDRAILIPNCQYWAHAHRAVAHIYLGNKADAEAALTRVRAEVPSFSIAFVQAKMFFLRRDDQLSLYLDGLRGAGVPEHA
ncbi:MAG: tetratricopeptide repeat protein [Pseudomonadota bacterium]